MHNMEGARFIKSKWHMWRKGIDPSEVSGKEVARNVHILIASSYFKNVCFRPVIISSNKTLPVVLHPSRKTGVCKLYSQVECDFRYLHHVTWHDSRTSTRSRRFTSSSPWRASILLLLALSYSLLTTSLPFYFFIVVSPLTRRPFSYSANFVTIAGSIGICCTCRESINNKVFH